MYKAICIAFSLALIVAIPAIASANQLDLFGFNSRATGLANAYSALAEGPEATFYNPGALIQSKRIMAFGGFGYTVPALSLDRQTRGGSDLSSPNEMKQAQSVEAGQFINAGVSGGIYDRVFFGLGLQVPVDGASRRKIFSADRPYFLDYDTGIFGMTFLPAVAVQVAPNYGIGLGVRITMDPFGTQWTDIPTAEGDFQTTTLSTSKFSAQAAPIFGFYGRSHEFLSFALTFQGQSYSYYHKTVQERLVPSDPDGVVEIEYEAKYNFIPRRLTLAVAGEPDEHVLITGEVAWVNWANYEAPFPTMRLDFSRMNDAGIPYTRPETIEPDDPEFNNTWVPRFGVEARPYKFLNFRLGYAYEPPSVGFQDGTTTILDASTNVLAFGAGANFGGERGDFVTLDFAIMDHILSSRYSSKDKDNMEETDPTTNPAWPRYEAGGHYIYSSMTATFRF